MEKRDIVLNVLMRHLKSEIFLFNKQEGTDNSFIDMGKEDSIFIDRKYKENQKISTEIKRYSLIVKDVVKDLESRGFIMNDYAGCEREDYLGPGKIITIFLYWKKD